MKIYTRRGDRGETDLLGGGRVGKDDLRVEACGAVDELNSHLGLCRAATAHEDLRSILEGVQALLFDLGGSLASSDAGRGARAGVTEPAPEDVEAVERRIDTLERELEPLANFILPGGTAASAAFHAARAVCRRAERRAVALHRQCALGEASLRTLNRLSDLLFVMARVENRRAGVEDVAWRARGRTDP